MLFSNLSVLTFLDDTSLMEIKKAVTLAKGKICLKEYFLTLHMDLHSAKVVAQLLI